MAIVRIDTSEVHALAADLQTRPARVELLAEAAVARGGHQVVANTMVLAPVDTGALKGSQTVDVDGLTFEAGPTVEHGVYQELGTSEMPPQPSLGPGFDQALPGIEADLADAGVRALGW